MDEPLLQVRGLRRSYGTTVVTEVLRGIDLDVRPREFVALVGPSGSGKSTLLNQLGLLDVPTAGSVRLLGRETVGMDDAERTALRGFALGFVFQFHHLLPSFRAWENVALPAAATSGRFGPALRARAVELLEAVGLGHKVEARADELSGGQQQRVAIARALCMRPRLVLADEPTGNLDSESADQVFEVLRRTHLQDGPAFIIVTHDPRIAARCDRIVTLVDGAVVGDAPAQP